MTGKVKSKVQFHGSSLFHSAIGEKKARGYWTQDRRYWRIFSPWVSACIAVVVGCMVVSGYINADQNPSIAVGTCIGFISGYFADEAVGKMSEVAIALFGSNTKAK